MNTFFLLMQNFIELYEVMNYYKCPANSSLQNASIFRNLPKHKIVRSPPEHFAIGLYVLLVHNDNLPLGNIALQYHSNQLQEGLLVFSDDFLHFLKIKKKFVEFTKTILWL